jgi:hypothetical protein
MPRTPQATKRQTWQECQVCRLTRSWTAAQVSCPSGWQAAASVPVRGFAGEIRGHKQLRQFARQNQSWLAGLAEAIRAWSWCRPDMPSLG